MSSVATLAARLPWMLSLALACQGAKPPESTVPEAPSSPAPSQLPQAGASAPPSPVPVIVESANPQPATPGDAPLVQTLFVREQRVPCQGEAPMQCLQVRNSEAEGWRNFYASIEGFNYEDAHAYELRVEVTRLPNPPMDSSSLRYRLLEVVTKRKRESSPQAP